ncbi:methyl-accepting chemotaxis protein [Acidocella sp.]|uniref:methyl-accepting chemotaxis protein n=1 Tax=Acidocella sp. TaxID=50710 RepID=UPI002634D3C2|nr:methyl-accepting chemotaxis protein [Acidocella sp.]
MASEVRALVQRSAEAAKAIKNLISTRSAQVEQGVELVSRTSSALDGIVTRVGQIDGAISGIATRAFNQSSGLGEVNKALGQMNNAVQQSTAMMGETSAAVHALRGEIKALNGALRLQTLAHSRAGPSALTRPPSVGHRLSGRLPWLGPKAMQDMSRIRREHVLAASSTRWSGG